MSTWLRNQLNRRPTDQLPLYDSGDAVGASFADQLESLLDQVWRCEHEWALDDRIALGCRLQSKLHRRRKGG